MEDKQKIENLFDENLSINRSLDNVSQIDGGLPKIKQNSSMIENISQVPESRPLIEQTYSLEPDYQMGWRPDPHFSGSPIPLSFDYEDKRLKNYLKKQKKNIVFYGERPQDSLLMHKIYLKKSSYPFKFPNKETAMLINITRNCNKEFSNPRSSGNIKDSPLLFDSCFESGNLDVAIQTGEREYDLLMRSDCNTRGHHQWFFFRVNNKANTGVFCFNIINFTKKNSLYLHGMKVWIYSEKETALDDVKNSFCRGGENILYKKSRLNKETSIKKLYYSLSFDYHFHHDNDSVYFAYSAPYTFSTLLSSISEIFNPEFMTQEVLCKTLSGIELPILTITSQEKNESISENKKIVFLTARVHPGETCGSYMMHGFLRFLCSHLPTAVALRRKVIFKIIPMLNPDGVISGNYRSCLSGQDLNRKFDLPDSRLHPEICAIKNLIKDLIKSNFNIIGYIDLHAHSKKKCAFLYGPHFPLHSPKYLQVRIIGKLISECTQTFRRQACRYREEPGRMSSARLALSSEFGIMNCLTFEASFHGYIREDRTTQEFQQFDYEMLGKHLCDTLFDYAILLEEQEQSSIRRLIEKRFRRKTFQPANSTNMKEEKKSQIINFEKNKTLINDKLLQETPHHNKNKLEQILEKIKDEIKLESDDSSSDSSQSEFDPLSEGEQKKVIQTIIESMEGKNRKGNTCLIKKKPLGNNHYQKSLISNKKILPRSSRRKAQNKPKPLSKIPLPVQLAENNSQSKPEKSNNPHFKNWNMTKKLDKSLHIIPQHTPRKIPKYLPKPVRLIHYQPKQVSGKEKRINYQKFNDSKYNFEECVPQIARSNRKFKQFHTQEDSGLLQSFNVDKNITAPVPSNIYAPQFDAIPSQFIIHKTDSNLNQAVLGKYSSVVPSHSIPPVAKNKNAYRVSAHSFHQRPVELHPPTYVRRNELLIKHHTTRNKNECKTDNSLDQLSYEKTLECIASFLPNKTHTDALKIRSISVTGRQNNGISTVLKPDFNPNYLNFIVKK